MTFTERERALLDRHRPLLLYDPQEDLRAMSIESVTVRRNLLRADEGDVLADHDDPDLPDLTLEEVALAPAAAHVVLAPDVARTARRLQRDPAYANRVYGRVKEHDGRTWLQYWLWLYDNPKNVMGLGSHQGDWEMVQVGLAPGDVPEVVTVSQHKVGESRDWAEVDQRDSRPVVYVSMLSHALYFDHGTQPYPGGIDHPYPGGPAPDITVEPFGGWESWGGRWGDRVRVMRGRFGNPPQSPGRQKLRWDTPGDFKDGDWRWASRLFRRVGHFVGRATYPRDPTLSARLGGKGVVVTYGLGRGFRGGRHLYLTVHTADGAHVLSTRRLQSAPRSGDEEFRVPGAEPGLIVRASSFNRIRQRSNVVSITV
jgi:hypothetical protein